MSAAEGHRARSAFDMDMPLKFVSNDGHIRIQCALCPDSWRIHNGSPVGNGTATDLAVRHVFNEHDATDWPSEGKAEETKE